MKTSTKTVLVCLILLVAGIFLFKMTGRAVAEPGVYDDFAQCLGESGAKMYGAYWCPHCTNQKKMFGSSEKLIPYIECDARGNNAQTALCQENKIEGYPTWIFADGTRRSGEIPLRTLASLTGCELPE